MPIIYRHVWLFASYLRAMLRIDFFVNCESSFVCNYLVAPRRAVVAPPMMRAAIPSLGRRANYGRTVSVFDAPLVSREGDPTCDFDLTHRVDAEAFCVFLQGALSPYFRGACGAKRGLVALIDSVRASSPGSSPFFARGGCAFRLPSTRPRSSWAPLNARRRQVVRRDPAPPKPQCPPKRARAGPVGAVPKIQAGGRKPTDAVRMPAEGRTDHPRPPPSFGDSAVLRAGAVY